MYIPMIGEDLASKKVCLAPPSALPKTESQDRIPAPCYFDPSGSYHKAHNLLAPFHDPSL